LESVASWIDSRVEGSFLGLVNPASRSATSAKSLWGLTRNLRKPRNTAKCLPTPSLRFGNSASAFCCPGTGRQPAVESAAPLSRQHPHDARDSRSSLGAAPRSKFALQRQPSVRQAALEQLPTTNAVHDRLLQSMRVRFSDSEQWSSPVKPPRSQNYVKPHNARTRVHVAKQVVALISYGPCSRGAPSSRHPPSDSPDRSARRS
jgi:hypothetical protein